VFTALVADPGLLPADHQQQIPTQGLARTVADYIAGMTDSYIEQIFNGLPGHGKAAPHPER
jgi:dGTPase